MADERGKNPADDIVTALIQADIEGEKLSDDEFGFFVMMLAVAGNETTRNSITHGMIALRRKPRSVGALQEGAARDRGRRDRPLGHPGHRFQRTALEDTELAGVQIKKGQRVVMFYRSANFDEEVFEDPYTFNILRNPNPHVGFGGTGAHLLHRRQPGPDDDQPDLQCGRRPHARSQARSASPSGYGPAGSTASSTGRSTTPARAPADSVTCIPQNQGGFGWTSVRTKEQQAVADVVTSVLDRDNSWDALVAGGVIGARRARTPRR